MGGHCTVDKRQNKTERSEGEARSAPEVQNPSAQPWRWASAFGPIDLLEHLQVFFLSVLCAELRHRNYSIAFHTYSMSTKDLLRFLSKPAKPR
ncbi:hypothetical protein VTL71DRAFT_5743, partial [Oculimacula yallundae]